MLDNVTHAEAQAVAGKVMNAKDVEFSPPANAGGNPYVNFTYDAVRTSDGVPSGERTTVFIVVQCKPGTHLVQAERTCKENDPGTYTDGYNTDASKLFPHWKPRYCLDHSTLFLRRRAREVCYSAVDQ